MASSTVSGAVAGLLRSPDAVEAAEDTRKPNIVFMLIDDLGWIDLGCYGSRFHQTPNIDRMASEGMRFTDAYAACPVCSPTRASIMTGKYPARLHLTDWIPGYFRPYAKLLSPEWQKELPQSEITIAESLKKAGYVTACFGKWHLGGEATRHGFDRALFGDKVRSHFYPYFGEGPQPEGREGEYMTDRLTDEAVGFIREHRSRPFFLYLTHYAVHRPINAKQPLVEKYKKLVRTELSQTNPDYAAMVESVDDSVGRILKELDDLALSKNTLFVFFSDNGGLARQYAGIWVTKNEPLREGKGFLYEGGVRVPFIARMPGRIRPGSQSDAPVISTDFYPTFLSLAGISTNPQSACDGVDLTPLLSGGGGTGSRALYWHYPHYHLSAPAGAVRSGHLKLIEYYEDGRTELYDLASDISEANDLAGSRAADARRLADQLRGWRESVGAQMMRANPNYDPARAGENA